MIPFSHSCIITALLSLMLGGFVLYQNRSKTINLLWSLFCSSVFFWSLGLGLMVKANSIHQALLCLRWIHYLGAIMIPIFFFHFVTIFLDLKKTKWIFCGYGLAAFQQVVSLSGWLANVQPLKPFNFYTVPLPLYGVFVVYFFTYVFYAHLLLYKALRHSTVNRKNQIHYIFVGTSIGFLGGSTAFLPVFGLPVFPYGVYGVCIYVVTVTHAILHNQFMDIRLILRDTTLHITTAVVLGATCLFFGIPLASYNSALAVVFSTVAMGLLMAFAYDPIRKALQPALDRIMFANRFSYLEELGQLPNDMLEFTNLREMLKFLVTRLQEAGRLQSVRVLMFDPGNQSYIESISRDLNDNDMSSIDRPRELPERSELALVLKDDSRLWTVEELLTYGSNGSFAAHSLQEFYGAACFPVMREKELIGIVILGPKKSGEPLNQQDLKILRALRVRLENFLGQAMTITQEALNMVKDSHDMKNDVNALKGRVTWRAMKIASWKMDFEKQMGSLDSWLTAEAAKGAPSAEHAHVTEAVHSLKKQALEWFAEAVHSRSIEENAIQRLAHRLKNWAEYGRVVSEGFKGSRQKEVVDVGAAAKLSVERWRPMAERKSLKIAAQVSGAPVVWGERSLVEQIIENLIDNAIKATSQGSVDVLVNATAHYVHMEVRDSGCGIPEEHIGTIFAKPFYQGRGRETMEQSTGVGLYLVAQYAKSLGGKVHAESEFGHGSVFAVDLPVARADAGKQEGVAA